VRMFIDLIMNGMMESGYPFDIRNIAGDSNQR